MLEAEAEDKILTSRLAWLWGLDVTACLAEYRGARMVCEELWRDENQKTLKTTADRTCHSHAQKSGMFTDHCHFRLKWNV